MIFIRSPFSRDQKESNIHIIRSHNHEMYPQRVQNSTLSPIDDRRWFENIIGSKPWN